MDIQTIRSVYFVGIGGIGMSALARYFLSHGLCVAGYDRTSSELTRSLSDEGAEIHYKEDVSLIPAACLDSASTLVVYTPAVPAEHEELCFFQHRGFEVMKRAQVLGLITRSLKALCVAGTHGKTTTSTMLAHLLYGSPVGCNAFLGGISKNYGTNHLLSGQSDYVVVEADEYDRSFHQLTPYVSIITSADPDHLDIYHTEEAYLESFNHYTSLIRPDGFLILHEGTKVSPRVPEGVAVYTYSRDKGDFHADHIRIGEGRIVFDFRSPLGDIPEVSLGVPVSINIDNGIAAMAASQLAGVPNDLIKLGMESFRGVDRRFDFRFKSADGAFLCDYAHHPSEIRQCALSLRELYADKRITVVFQPHLYSRTRDFYPDFAESLSLFDEVILLDIYPAREKPIPGVTSRLIHDALSAEVSRAMCRKDELPALLQSRQKPEVLVLLGAGDVDLLAPEIEAILKN